MAPKKIEKAELFWKVRMQETKFYVSNRTQTALKEFRAICKLVLYVPNHLQLIIYINIYKYIIYLRINFTVKLER